MKHRARTPGAKGNLKNEKKRKERGERRRKDRDLSNVLTRFPEDGESVRLSGIERFNGEPRIPPRFPHSLIGTQKRRKIHGVSLKPCFHWATLVG